MRPSAFWLQTNKVARVFGMKLAVRVSARKKDVRYGAIRVKTTFLRQTVNGPSSSQVGSTLSSLHSTFRESSKIQIQVFDQRRFKRDNQGFGFVSITVGDVLNLTAIRAEVVTPPFPPFSSVLQSFSYVCIIPASSLGLTAKSYGKFHVLAHHRRPRFLSWQSASPTTRSCPVLQRYAHIPLH